MYRYTLNSASTSKSKLIQNETISEHQSMTPIKVNITSCRRAGSQQGTTSQYSFMSLNHPANSTALSSYKCKASVRSTPDHRHHTTLLTTNPTKEFNNNHHYQQQQYSHPKTSSANVERLNAYLTDLTLTINRRTELTRFKRAVTDFKDRYLQDSAQALVNCDCTLCSSQFQPLRMEQKIGFNARNLLSVIDDIRPTVKIHQNSRNTGLNEKSYQRDNIVTNDQKGKVQNMRKIELWNEKEVRSLIQSEQLNSQSNDKIDVHAINRDESLRRFHDDPSSERNKNNLIRIFKEFKLNPYLSPLIKQLEIHSELRNGKSDNNIASTPHFYRRNMPENPPVTPMY